VNDTWINPGEDEKRGAKMASKGGVVCSMNSEHVGMNRLAKSACKVPTTGRGSRVSSEPARAYPKSLVSKTLAGIEGGVGHRLPAGLRVSVPQATSKDKNENSNIDNHIPHRH